MTLLFGRKFKVLQQRYSEIVWKSKLKRRFSNDVTSKCNFISVAI